MGTKIFVVTCIVLFVIYAAMLIKLCVDSVTRFDVDRIADCHVHSLKYEVRGELHKLDRRQDSLEWDMAELKSALNEQGIATGYTTEKKLYYKEKENEQNKM